MLAEMRISVLSWTIATLLATFSGWIIVAAYLGRDRGGCTPSCSDLRVPLLIAAGVLLGAIVSASIGQLSKPRPAYVKWLIRAGGVIFFLASSAFLISTSPVALVLIFISLIIITMIFLSGRASSTGNDQRIMFIAVFSWVIAALLVASVVLLTALAYAGRNEGSCDPTCFDPGFAAALIAFGLFGAAVSASIGQFSKPRMRGTRGLTKLGVAVYLLASFATFIVLPGAASIALILFIPTGVMMVVMVAVKEL